MIKREVNIKENDRNIIFIIGIVKINENSNSIATENEQTRHKIV